MALITLPTTPPVGAFEAAVIYETESGFWVTTADKETSYSGIKSKDINYIKVPQNNVVLGGVNGHTFNVNDQTIGGLEQYIKFVKSDASIFYIEQNVYLVEVLRILAGFNNGGLPETISF
jgi:hypothetical protein